MENLQMVTISLDRYDELLDLETRATLLMEYTQESTYSVDREVIAHYLNFILKEEVIKKGADDGERDCSKET